jgi:hypothetical protein
MFSGHLIVDKKPVISRRHFILGAAIATGGAVAGIQLYRSNIASPGELAVAGMVVSLAELPGAIRFGEVFRKQQQKQNKSIASVKNISDRLYKNQEDLHQDNIDEALEHQIQMELRTNQVYLVDDWYLTRTEADLCALASIIKI